MKTKLTHDQIRMARTLGLTAARARIVAKLAGDEQGGYSDETDTDDAPDFAGMLQALRKRSGLTSDELTTKRARKIQVDALTKAGCDEDLAEELAALTDDALEARALEARCDDADLDDADLGTGDADDDADASTADALANEARKRREQKGTMGVNPDSPEAARSRQDMHTANGLSDSEARRISSLSDEDLRAELAELDDDDDDADDDDDQDDEELARGRVECSRGAIVEPLFRKGAA